MPRSLLARLADPLGPRPIVRSKPCERRSFVTNPVGHELYVGQVTTDLLSRTQVDKAGEVLRKQAAVSHRLSDGSDGFVIRNATGDNQIHVTAEAMQTIARFRAGHFEAMNQTFTGLIPMAKAHYGIAGFRHKRVAAIVDKLRRLSGRLSQMSDIAGCRVVVPCLSDVLSVRNEIERTFKIKAVKDYIENPKPVGYRGVHLVAEIADGNNQMRPGATSAPVEIQIRTRLQGEWADTIERLTDKTGYDLKGGDPARIPSDLFEYVSVAAELHWLADSGLAPDTALEARLIELRNQTKRYWG